MRNSSKRSIRFVGVLVALMLGVAAPSGAQLIYSNGVPDNLQGYAVFDPWGTANDFPILSSTQLGSFDWYVIRNPGGGTTISSNFDWTVYADAGGTIGSAVGSGNVTNATGTLTPFFCCGTPYYETYLISGVSFGGLTLGSGVYWLAINNYVDPTDTPFGYWATSAQVGNQMQADASGWYPTSAEGAFSIYGTESTVPEPASLALLATGLVSLIPTLRRKFRS